MLSWAKEIKHDLWPSKPGLLLARAWLADQAFHSHDIKHTLESCSRLIYLTSEKSKTEDCYIWMNI
jgi:hypothetical protein